MGEVIQTEAFSPVAAAGALSPASTKEEISAVLMRSVRTGIEGVAMTSLLRVLKGQTRWSLADLRAILKSAKLIIDAERERGVDGEAEAVPISEKEKPKADIGTLVVNETLRRYCNDGKHIIKDVSGVFWVYAGTHWFPASDDQILHMIEIVSKDIRETIGLGKSIVSMMNEAFQLIGAKQASLSDELGFRKEPKAIINCKNTELIFDASVVCHDEYGKELRYWFPVGGFSEHEHDYRHYLRSCLPIDYDPAATCPRFDRALEEIFAKSSDPAEMARHFMEFVGYAIQPARDIASFFILTGAGANGKSMLMRVIQELVGQEAICSKRIGDFENDKFAIGALPGKLILLDDDVKKGTKLPDGFLKTISERKLLTGEQKYKNQFEFVATCLPIMLANNLPVTDDLSDGMRRRVRFIPFARTFTETEQDRGLAEYIIKHEMSGVLNRAIAGLQRLRQRGRFLEPGDCSLARDAWLDDANPLKVFLNEKYVSAIGSKTTMREFCDHFGNWARDRGIETDTKQSVVQENLRCMGHNVTKTNKGMTLHGWAQPSAAARQSASL